MSVRIKALAFAAGLTLLGGIAAAGTAHASTQTCNSCVHVQNVYAFRGALDAEHAGTAVNTPLVLWYETPSTTDSGADLLGVSAGTVIPSTTITNFGQVNQSNVNWDAYLGDSVVRFQYDPFGDNGANTYMGLNGTRVALRNDNPDSVWQEFIEVPVTRSGAADGCTAASLSLQLAPGSIKCSGGTAGPNGTAQGLAGVPNACGTLNPTGGRSTADCVLIDVGQTANPQNPEVVTDPSDSDTGSLVQQVVSLANVNQNGDYPTNEVWDFQA